MNPVAPTWMRTCHACVVAAPSFILAFSLSGPRP
jgi:hypothetical protein